MRRHRNSLRDRALVLSALKANMDGHMNRAQLDQRMEQATREVDRTRKEWQDAKPPDKPRAWSLHQRALNRMNAAIAAANQRPVRTPIFGADETE